MASNYKQDILIVGQVLSSVQRVVEECGFDDIVPKTWVAPVNGIVPGYEFHVHWDALWSEQASGVSLQQLFYEGNPKLEKEKLLNFLHHEVNSTEVRNYFSDFYKRKQSHKFSFYFCCSLTWTN